MRNCTIPLLLATTALALLLSVPASAETLPTTRVALVGNGLGAFMEEYGHFETEMQIRNPDSQLVIRNLCAPGFTPVFRPHPSRKSQWAIPGGEKIRPRYKTHAGIGHFPTDDEWLMIVKPDVIAAFFGFNESFEGEAGLDKFKAELVAFIEHTRAQKYDGLNAARLYLVSPIAFQNLSGVLDLPDGKTENKNLALYTQAMKNVCAEHKVRFIDLFTPTTKWFAESNAPLTVNGAHLTEEGYKKLAPLLAGLLLPNTLADPKNRKAVHAAVMDKNWFWFNDYRMLNGVHSYGRRWKPFGDKNYPEEIEKLRELTNIRDKAIWAAVAGQKFDRATADSATRKLTPVKTNAEGRRKNEYLEEDDALKKFTVPEGYKIELFASEKEFPNLANPVQMSFDNKGRLWVSVMPSYPHFKPGDARPNDKLLIYEDTNGDGKADKETVFADGLHLPIGFEFAPEGVYVAQEPHLVLLRDTDGNDKADTKQIMLSGFDSHDTHHAISAFCADPSGSFMMCEGVFLHTNVETAYGPVRGVNGGFYRYSPQRQRLERTIQTSIPNPWGFAFDRWGQDFFIITSGVDMHWGLPVSVNTRHGQATPRKNNLIDPKHRVRPTSGLEFVSSRHFPDEVQGDIVLCNAIGFLGAKQHTMVDSGTGYTSKHRHDLFKSSDPNFRPVDLEFAPDGSLYFVDWNNRLIGHMQHSARDPLRDHDHGRIYRITYPDRPLVKPAKVDGASIPQLLKNLQLPEYRTRYRSRRELRSRPTDQVLDMVGKWTASLKKDDPNYEHHLLEALWVTWGMNTVDDKLLRRLLAAKSHKVRSAAVRVLRYNIRSFPDHAALLLTAAGDQHGRVRLEAIIAASWLDNSVGLQVVEEAGKRPIDDWIKSAYDLAKANLSGMAAPVEDKPKAVIPEHLTDQGSRESFERGHDIYLEGENCLICHQPDGNGLTGAFPPLAGSAWATGDETRAIKIVLRGMMGPVEVKGVKYPGVAMRAFSNLEDKQIADVLTYVRNAWGNKAAAVTPDSVNRVRAATTGRDNPYLADELLKDHPFKK